MIPLDTSLYYASERTSYISKQLDIEQQIPTERELEYYANYILFGKDEHYQSLQDRKLMINPNRDSQHPSLSVDAIMDSENNSSEDLKDTIMTQAVSKSSVRYKSTHPTITRSTYDTDGTILVKGDDFDANGNPIAAMRELWERIDYYQNLYNKATGRLPLEPGEKLPPNINTTAIYKLLLDLRRQQYFIKLSYNPPIPHPITTRCPSQTETIDLDSNAGYFLSAEDWCARKRNPHPYDIIQPSFQEVPTDNCGHYYWRISSNKIDYENPRHMYGIMKNYANLLLRSYEHLNSDARIICYDFERFVGQANLTPLEHMVLVLTVANKTASQIADAMILEGSQPPSSFDVQHLRSVIIPRKLSLAATKQRLEAEVECGVLATKLCSKCHRRLPASPVYFHRSREKTSGLSSQCKECRKKEVERLARERRAAEKVLQMQLEQK